MNDETCHLRMARFVLSHRGGEHDIIKSLYEIFARGFYESIRKGD